MALLFASVIFFVYLCTRKGWKPLRHSLTLNRIRSDLTDNVKKEYRRVEQMRYTIVIEEILRREVAVEAKDAEEAEEIVEALYSKGEIVLDAGDFIGEPTITCK